MATEKTDFPFRSDLSLKPLIDFWKDQLACKCSYMGQMFRGFEQQIQQAPELVGTIDDVSLLEKHQDLLMPLMSVIFPASSWETEIVGVLEPCQTSTFYASPRFRRLLTTDGGMLKGYSREDQGNTKARRLLRAYLTILEKIYGIHRQLDTPSVQVVPDPETGLDRFFRLSPDLRFVDVFSVGNPPQLSSEDRRTIIANITDLQVLARFIPGDKFRFQGFSIIRAVDVTRSEVISALQTDLIDRESIFSADGFGRVLERLQTLFARSDLRAAIGSVQEDKVLVIKGGLPSSANCMFTNSTHIPLADFKGSFWFKAVEQETTLRIPDLKEYADLNPINQRALAHGARSLVATPLFYQGDVIGFFGVVSPRPNDLEPLDAMLAQQIAPLFSVALKRGVDEMNREAQAIIKEKCTAVHPVVEWRFRQAAFQHMDRLRMGQPSEMEPIIFKDLIPLFAQTDIRGSSTARNTSIQTDLTDQLRLTKEVMDRAGDVKDWPLLQEFKFRIDQRIQNLTAAMASDEEAAAMNFIKKELEPTFEDLVGLGPRVSRAVENYQSAIDPDLGVVYRKRRAFEESVSLLNERLSVYLEEQEARAQAIVPHYFEKHQTDGLDYVIYVGSSINPDGKFSKFHIQNMRLWQLMVACGMAWHTEQLKLELKMPLDTCQLILASNTPLSVRFRYDEKRFDVDGAYDIRYEIIKSRLDKATVKGNGQRLTQPGRLAVAYSQPEEGREMRRHIEFLTSIGHMYDDLEFLDIEEVSGVKGIKAIRAGINLEKEHNAREAVSALV